MLVRHREILRVGAQLRFAFMDSRIFRQRELNELYRPSFHALAIDGGWHFILVVMMRIQMMGMLYYMYGGKLAEEELKVDAKDIIDAADKYGIVSLKLEAEASYVKSTTLTNDNIIDNLLYADAMNCALLKEAVMDYIVENGDDILGKVSFDNVPGSTVSDILAAMARGKKKSNDSNDDSINYNKMRVCALRKMLHDKGLDVDGSREAMISALKASEEESE